MKHNWSFENLSEAVKKVKSKAELFRLLGINIAGGNHDTLAKYLSLYSIDTSHWTGSGHLKGKTHNWSAPIPLEEILVRGRFTSSSKLKKRLFRAGLLKERCAECKITSEWNGRPLSLHLDHINGDRSDNRIENLRVLCPNCHSQTKTYCRRKSSLKNPSNTVSAIKTRASPKTNTCPVCNVKQKGINSKRCLTCYKKELVSRSKGRSQPTKVTWPSPLDLQKLLWKKPTRLLAIELGVSDSAIGKFCKKYNLTKPPRGYWQTATRPVTST